MLPLTATYQNKQISFEMPTSWDEVTIGQFIKLTKWNKKDYLDLLAIMTGLEREVIYHCEADSFENSVIKNLDWIKDAPDLKLILVPKKITIDGREFEVPGDLKLKTFGQKLSTQIFLDEAVKKEMTIADCIPYALAIYFQPEYEGKDYDEDRAKVLIPLMEKCKLFEAYPVGTFFLNRLMQSFQWKRESLPQSTPVKKLQQEWKNLVHSVGSLPLMRWLRATS